MLDVMDLRMGPPRCLEESRRRLEALRFDQIGVVRVGSFLGAEVRGVDLGKELAEAVVQEIEHALVEYKVLFFRNQQIDVVQQGSFAGLFGELEVHPFLPSNTEHPHVISFEKGMGVRGVENIWHSDVSWREVPSLGSVLRAIEVPEIGGDTVWADMEAAYEGLPEDVKERIEDLVAVHDFANSFGRMLTPEQLAERRAQFPPAGHPVVRRHPVSGRRCLYVNAIFTSHIVGLSAAESDALLSLLYQQAAVPEYQVRFRWWPGSVAFWDNRSTQHYATSDYFPDRRVMERVTIIGDRPFA